MLIRSLAQQQTMRELAAILGCDRPNSTGLVA
jgi:hypothetical protein